tara:strand:+ start:255 stop:488 length:234 start_codon:yes stop_codon:yes gene_type:complete
MRFKQFDDGSCDIEFSDAEIKMLNEKKKIFLDARSFRNFGNILIKMVAEWQTKFDNDVKKLTTYGEDTEDPDINKAP